MGKELVLVFVAMLSIAVLVLTPARQYLPDGVQQGIERIIRGAGVNVQGPTVQYP